MAYAFPCVPGVLVASSLRWRVVDQCSLEELWESSYNSYGRYETHTQSRDFSSYVSQVLTIWSCKDSYREKGRLVFHCITGSFSKFYPSSATLYRHWGHRLRARGQESPATKTSSRLTTQSTTHNLSPPTYQGHYSITDSTDIAIYFDTLPKTFMYIILKRQQQD